MKFEVRNDDYDLIWGTGLMGMLCVPYDKLVEAFGQPGKADGYKSDAEWIIRFQDGLVAAIYNWKDGPSYLGEGGTPVERIACWHVGGKDRRALWRLKDMLLVEA